MQSWYTPRTVESKATLDKGKHSALCMRQDIAGKLGVVRHCGRSWTCLVRASILVVNGNR